ncbi:isoleucyl-tRNA synthetase [Sulfurospirillum sp. 1612]|uniref:isoleucyl-tRNA synthetase n=1 Tax=Sulfurospirillum sp. 1612 TaxID=3094835 RepID=UPI002F958C97
MIYRIVNSFFMGLAFVSLLDFLYFIGIKLNYFNVYGINEYFNILFIDNQNFYMLIIAAFVVGYLLLYSGFSKIFMRLYLLCIVVSALSLYEPVGKYFAQKEFMLENQSFQVGHKKFQGDLLYQGRDFTYIYRKDLAKTVKISNHDVINTTP